MKKKTTFILKACIAWAFLLFFFLPSIGAEKKKSDNTFEAPDFAFPKTVAANAAPELKKALRNNDGPLALQALIQTVIADNLISSDNAGRGARLIDSVAEKLPSPYSGLAYLLEARLYREVYNENQYVYNNRSLPSTPGPEDVNEWSREMFADKVSLLTKKALADAPSAKTMGFSTVASIVNNASEASAIGLTLYDFMVMQSVANLQPFVRQSANTIPFFAEKDNEDGNAAALIKSILSANESWHREKGLTRASAAMAAYRLDNVENNGASDYESLVKEYADTPYAARFLIRLIGSVNPSDSKEYSRIYALGSDYLRRFPECIDASALSNALASMCDVVFSANVPAQSLPGKEIKGEVTARNISDFYILAIKVGNVVWEDRECSKHEVLNGKLVAAVKVETGESAKPFYKTVPFSIPSLESGVYALAFSTTPDVRGLVMDAYDKNKNIYPVVLVSRLAVIKSADNRKKEDNQVLFVVDGTNQKPVADATVKFIPAWKNSRWKTVTASTDRNGMVVVPSGSYKVAVKSGDDILMESVYEAGFIGDSRETLQGALLTDLSIYHSGDSVGFSGILYLAQGTSLRAASDREVKVILNDANYQPKDTLSLKSDKFGRVSGKFQLPSDGLLGSWSLQLNDSQNYIAQRHFEVADYKSPTFYVTAEGTEGEVTLGETVRIRGDVRTYSGMPVAGADIKFNVNFVPWRWGRRPSNARATYGGEAKTEADGSFIIELPTAGLKDTPYAYGGYQLNITATNPAGETQEASPVSFSLGKAYRISADINPYIKVGSEKMAPVKVGVYDILNHPVVKNIYYRVVSLPDSVEVASGEFESGRFPLDFSKLKSGRYSVCFALNPAIGEDTDGEGMYESSFIVWRAEDKKPPVETPLWLPENSIIVNAANTHNGKVKVKTGTSYKDSYLYAELADKNGVYDRRWLRVSDGMVEIPVDAPKADERVKVSLSGMHDLKGVQSSVTLIPEIQTKGLEISAETFRDRLVPGAREEWKFRFSFDNKELPNLPVMAVMSNKALDALAPFQWNFDPYSSIYWNLPGGVSGQNVGVTSWRCKPTKDRASNVEALRSPAWNTYGYPLYPGRYYASDAIAGSTMVRGTRMMKAMAYQEAAVKEDADLAVAYQEAPVTEAIEEETVVSFGTTNSSADMVEDNGSEPKAAPQEVSPEAKDIMREIECPLAFFMPDLVTAEDGTATLSFDVPMYNGTWQLQVMGYTPDMHGAVLKRDAVASKPVMVQLNAPRFARTGDLLYVSATVYNNTPDEAQLKGKIEFFNPLSGEVYAFLEPSPEAVAPMGSRVITESMRIPSDIDMLGIRVYGSGEISRDGEQTVIPVFPSSTPVTESETFYLAPGEENFTMQLPQNAGNGTVTLTYTDNPVWECVTALPSITDTDSKNAIAQAAALYGNSMASGLLKKYPQLAQALRLFADPANSKDSTLVSNLQKNASLKIVALNNTPWVNDAQSQTLRMSRLSEYAVPGNTEKAIESNLKALSELQRGDGGWSWCQDMASSKWISQQVLSHLAMLRQSEYLPGEARKMAEKGFAYVDKEIVNDWKRVGADKFYYQGQLSYLYIRSNYGKLSTSSDFAKIKARAIQEIAKNWKKMGVYDKAIAAIVLYREGNQTLARTILKSLDEYSSSAKTQGIWFDNLRSDYDGKGKLLTTAQVLEAWSVIAPDSPEIDGLRQWLLLSKQTQDWGNGTAAADIVHSILESGSDWTRQAAAPEIYIGGERIQPDRVSLLTGSITLPVTGKTGEIVIRRSASGPAWGGVVSQYVAPIAEVKAAKVPELSVEKAMYLITNDAQGTTASAGTLKQGDRVRITLTIKCDRDLEYVAVTDSRSAALQPADQVSGYVASDGVWMYREVRNESTNLFIPFLSKGTHIVTYDCFVDREGEYSLGIAEAQSQYAPVITAHSAGKEIKVGE